MRAIVSRRHSHDVPRRARTVFPEIAHHVTQRGNNRQQIFFVKSDYELYLELLTRHCRRDDVAVNAYRLMPNHVHLIAVPEAEDALSRALGRTHSEYALAFNRLHDRSGHLCQNRFFSCPLDRDHLARALLYVELNPVRAGFVHEASQWAWSSARARVLNCWLDGSGGAAKRTPAPCHADSKFTGTEWRAQLRSGLADAEAVGIRRSTLAGEPLGSQKFIAALERQAGHGLRVRERGRPRKADCGDDEWR